MGLCITVLEDDGAHTKACITHGEDGLLVDEQGRRYYYAATEREWRRLDGTRR